MRPVNLAAVLEAKWLGSLMRVRWLAAGLLPAWWLVYVADGLAPMAVPVLATAALVHVGFCTSLGVCLSVWTRGTGRATVAAVVVLVALTVIPLLAAGQAAALAAPYVRSPPNLVATQLEEALSPPLTWWRLVSTERQWMKLVGDGRLNAMLFGLLAYAGAAALLLGLAYWRFGRDDPPERRR